MAPQLKANPMVWSAGDPVPTVFFNTTCKIKNVLFDAYTGATDVVTLTDMDGLGTITLEGNVDLEEVYSTPVGWMRGLKLTAASLATTGKVMVFFE